MGEADNFQQFFSSLQVGNHGFPGLGHGVSMPAASSLLKAFSVSKREVVRIRQKDAHDIGRADWIDQSAAELWQDIGGHRGTPGRKRPSGRCRIWRFSKSLSHAVHFPQFSGSKKIAWGTIATQSNRLSPWVPSAPAQQAQGVVPEHETFLCGRQLRFPQAAQYEGRRDKVEVGAEDDALGAHCIER